MGGFGEPGCMGLKVRELSLMTLGEEGLNGIVSVGLEVVRMVVVLLPPNGQ